MNRDDEEDNQRDERSWSRRGRDHLDRMSQCRQRDVATWWLRTIAVFVEQVAASAATQADEDEFTDITDRPKIGVALCALLLNYLHCAKDGSPHCMRGAEFWT